MFAYCGNNPVSRKDDGGELWNIVIGAAIGATASIVSKMVTNALTNKPISEGLITAGIAGAVSGGLAASGVGLVGQVVGNAVIGAANNAVDQMINIKNGNQTDGFDVGSMFADAGIGAIAGFAGGSGAGSKNLTKIGVTNVTRSWNALTHKGVGSSLKVLGKGLIYFYKNSKYMAKPLFKAVTKSSASVIFCNATREYLI